jgi:flagellar brake protein
MSLYTQPAVLDSGGGIDAYAEFRVPHQREMQSLLKQLAVDATPVHLTGPDVSLTTVVWTVDITQGRINFSADADSPQLQQLLEMQEITCVAYLDAVKLQFDVGHLVLVRGTSSCALQSDMPREMYRFQRRGSFRVRTPLGRTTPTALMRHPSIPDMQLGLRVLDVSIGGCALLLPGDVPPLAAGLQISGVRIELDADTRFDAHLLLHHVTVIQTQSRGARLGCEFMHVQPQAQRSLQRYIDHTQKRRRLLSLD